MDEEKHTNGEAAQTIEKSHLAPLIFLEGGKIINLNVYLPCFDTQSHSKLVALLLSDGSTIRSINTTI